jgi:iron complex outermembrane receptor protein
MINVYVVNDNSQGAIPMKNRVAGLVSIVSGALATAAASAQSTPQPASQTDPVGSVLEEIVVTARYKEERLQDIGLSATAYSAETMRATGMKSFQDLAAMTPGLNLADRGPNKSNVSFRGLANLSPAYNWQRATAAVGIFLDDVSVVTPFSTQRSWNVFDMERIEVVRGPQGTLYGEGAMGGAVRFVTSDPSLAEVDGRVAATYGAYENGHGGNWRADGTVSLPLVEDRFGVRLTAFHQDDAGFIDYTGIGVEGGNDYQSWGGRVVLLAVPMDRLRLRASVTYEDSDLGSEWTVTEDPDKLENTNNFALEPQKDEALVVSARIDYQLAGGTLSSITGYWDRRRQDLGMEPNLSLGIGFPATKVFKMNDDGFSEELRFVSDQLGRARFSVSAYYKSSDQEFDGEEYSAVPSLPGSVLLENEDYSGEHYAIAGEFAYALTDRLTATVGARYFDETVDAHQVWTEPEVLFNGIPTVAFDTELSISEVLPKFLLEFRPNRDLLFYGGASRGARNGNLNITSTVVLSTAAGAPLPRASGADSAWSYEIGAKTSWDEDRLNANLAIYYIDWDDLQAEAGSPPIPIGAAETSLPYNANVGSARSVGGELELTWRPTPSVGISLVAGYTDAELRNSFVLNSVNGSTVPEGTDVPFTPEYKLAASVSGKKPLGDTMMLTGYLSYERTGAQVTGLFSDPVNVAIIPYEHVDAYDTLNVRAGIDFDRWSITAFVDNVTDENVGVATSGSSVASGINYFVNRPRTVGLTVEARF